MAEVSGERCPMCEYQNKDCPGGAHASALYEDGIRTVEDYIKKCVTPAEPSPTQRAPKVGVAVYCATCGHRKKPRGRSAPVGLHMCDRTCSGYDEAPHVGDLWPGETAEEFGYPCGDDGTNHATQRAAEEECEKCWLPKDHDGECEPAFFRPDVPATQREPELWRETQMEWPKGLSWNYATQSWDYVFRGKTIDSMNGEFAASNPILAKSWEKRLDALTAAYVHVESMHVHISHGGPTRADGERLLGQLRNVLLGEEAHVG